MQAKSSTNVNFIDVSHWQGDVDFKKVKAQGIPAAYVKSSEGKSGVDAKFAQNVKNAHAAGMLIGAYHFARPESFTAAEEAKHFVDLLKANPTDLMPCLDLESPTGKSNVTGAFLSKWARDFVNAVKKATGREVLLYTGNWFINQYGISGLGDIPLWISNYSNVTAPPDDGGWTKWVAWQYTDKAPVNGIGSCDMSVAVSLDALKGKAAPAQFVTMQVGSKGDNVKSLQTRLNALGFPTGTPDGGFGPKTAYGVNAFQTAHHLSVTGIVDQAVYNAIMAEPNYPTIKLQLNGQPFDDGIIVNAEGDDHTFVLTSAMATFGTPHTEKADCVVTINGVDVQGVLYKGNCYVMWKYVANDLFAEKIDGGYNVHLPYKLTEKGSDIMRYATEEEALSAGWDMFNMGHAELIEVTPTGDFYTFSKHPEKNPIQPVVAPTPAPEPIPVPVKPEPTPAPKPVDPPFFTGAGTPAPQPTPAPEPIPTPAAPAPKTDVQDAQALLDSLINSLSEQQKLGVMDYVSNFFKQLLRIGGNK